MTCHPDDPRYYRPSAAEEATLWHHREAEAERLAQMRAEAAAEVAAQLAADAEWEAIYAEWENAERIAP